MRPNTQPANQHNQPPAHHWALSALGGAMAVAATAGMLAETAAPVEALATSTVQNEFSNPNLTQTSLIGKPFTVATYNILGSNHVVAGRKVGGTVAARARRAADTIKGVGDGPHFDIAALQEVEPDQFRMLRNHLTHYGVASDPYDRMNTIFFDRRRFSLLGSKVINYPYYGDPYFTRRHGHAIEARLKDKDTNKVYDIINAHYVAWNLDRGSDDQGAEKRARTAEIMLGASHANADQHPKDTQIETGDENSDFFRRNHPTAYTYYNEPRDRAVTRDQLPYCVMTRRASFMQNTYDAAIGKYGHCPSTVSPFPTNQYNIDHIFYRTPQAQGVSTYVVDWQRVRNDVTRRTSDHDPIVVEFATGKR